MVHFLLFSDKRLRNRLIRDGFWRKSPGRRARDVLATVVACLLTFGLPIRAFGQEVAEYFEDNCAACHTIGGGRSVGPDLSATVATKSVDWFIDFTRNPDSAIESGDPYVVELFNEFDQMIMPGYPDLTDNLGEALYRYIHQKSDSAQTAPVPETLETESLQPGEGYFRENCAACHTIGGGAALGPDLRHVTWRKDFDWLFAFTRNPDSVVASGDPHAVRLTELFPRSSMPAFEDLSRAEARELYTYIESESKHPAPVDTQKPPTSQPDTLRDPSAGEAIFMGSRPLTNGGPGCFGCHIGGMTGNGGVLGPDLRDVMTRLGGRKGLQAWLSSPPTPIMRSVYRNQPISDQEISLLIDAFERWQAADGQRSDTSASLMGIAIGGGASGLCLILVLFALLWSRRYRGVRRELVNQATRRKLSA